MRRLVTLLVASTLAVAGCALSEDLSFDDVVGADEGPSRTEPTAPPGDVLEDPDEIVAVALDDVAAFWAEALPETYGIELEPLRGGTLAYGPTGPLPECGDVALSYEDVAENALYCPSDDLIAWDRVALIPDLARRFGPLTVGLVMAHEYGHAIQARGDVVGTTITLELQADCFAGAWVADVDDRAPTFATTADALDQALAGLLELRDTVGIGARDPDAHGSGFDRISAFQDGFEQGLGVCVDYEERPPEVVAIPFTSLPDARSGGNLPLADLVPPLVTDLESFFDQLLAERGRRWDPVEGGIELVDPAVDVVDCGGDRVAGDDLALASFWCSADDTLYLDGVDLVPSLDEIGDFAFGGELARLYAFVAQDQLGLDGDARASGLHADCLTGAFSAAEFLQAVPDQRLLLSPGDLDEVVQAFLAFGGVDEASAFERTRAFRAGFLGGDPACDDFLS